MSDPRTARQLLPALTGNGRGRLFAWLIACGLVQATSLAAAVWLTRSAIDGARNAEALLPFAIGLAVAGIVTALGRVWEKRLSERMGQRYVADLRVALLDAVATMPARALHQRRKGSLVLRYTGDLSSMRGWIGRGLVRIVVAGLTLPALLATLALVSADLAVAVGAVLVCGTLLTMVVGPVLQRRHHSARARRGALSVRMAERVMHPLTLRFASTPRRERKRLRRLNGRVIDETVRRGTVSAAVRAIPDMAGGCALALVVFLGARAVTTGELTVGGLVAAVAMVSLATRPLRDLAGVQDRRRAFIAARDRIVPILREGDGTNGVPLDSAPAIEVAGWKPTGGDVVDTRIEAGLSAAIVGGEGSGKTELLDSLAGLRVPKTGTIRLHEGREIEPGSVATRSIGYVSPRIPPFKGRVKALLRLRDASLDDAGCEELLRRAGAWDDLAERDGLQTKISEGGANLPLAPRMRLMLAVALAGNPRLLLVDDVELLGRPGLAALEAIAERRDSTLVVALRDPSPAGRDANAFGTTIHLNAASARPQPAPRLVREA